MVQIDLSEAQIQILTTLLNHYQQSGEPVKANTIAEDMDRTPGTVRNKMQGLKALGVVDSVPGPTGGYEPTETAFSLLERDNIDDRAAVTLSRDFERVNVTVDGITFPNVMHPDECTARIHFQQSLEGISVGDPVAVGPTPLSKLAVIGQVTAIHESADTIRLSVHTIEAPLTE